MYSRYCSRLATVFYINHLIRCMYLCIFRRIENNFKRPWRVLIRCMADGPGWAGLGQGGLGQAAGYRGGLESIGVISVMVYHK